MPGIFRDCKKTGSWVTVKSTQQVQLLDCARTIRYFEDLSDIRQAYEDLVRIKPKLVVFYEDLADNFNIEIGRILAFLGIGQIQLHSKFSRQSRGLEEIISNYDEIKRALSGTRWAWFLD